jgi:hypothetical protein
MVNVSPPAVIEPIRGAPAFAWTVKFTVALPLPPPEVTFIQASLLAAIQTQPAAVVTLKLPFPPAAETSTLVGVNVNVQPLLCVTVKVWPATVIEPDLAGPTFASTEYETVPTPVPFPPDVMCIQESLLTADHAHPASDSTPKLPLPPAAETFVLGGDSE